MQSLWDWGRSPGWGRTIKIPTGTKTCEPGPSLFPANARSMRQFGQPPVTEAESTIAPQIVDPAEQDCARPTDFLRAACPYGGEGFGFAEASLAALLRRVIVRVHDDTFRAINPAIALC